MNTAMYDSSQGGKSGAQIAVVTKSGSNAFHGLFYDHFQNTVLNAASFFRNASTAIANSDKVPALHYNRFGATIGGPIQKDKLFFFAAYQGIRSSDALSGSSNVTVADHFPSAGGGGAAQRGAHCELAPARVSSHALI